MALYHSTDSDGVSILNPDTAQMRVLLQSLNDPDNLDKDHPDVALIHDASGWMLSVYPSGIVAFENFNEPDEPPRYLRKLSQADCLKLWIDLSKGRIEAIKSKNWTVED